MMVQLLAVAVTCLGRASFAGQPSPEPATRYMYATIDDVPETVRDAVRNSVQLGLKQQRVPIEEPTDPAQEDPLDATDANDTEKYLLFESWGAGFNNERMSLEIAYLLALLWGRTLVLPPFAGDWSRASKQFRYQEYFDLAAMADGMRLATGGVATVLRAEDFVIEMQRRSSRASAPTLSSGSPSIAERRAFQNKYGRYHDAKRQPNSSAGVSMTRYWVGLANINASVIMQVLALAPPDPPPPAIPRQTGRSNLRVR